MSHSPVEWPSGSQILLDNIPPSIACSADIDNFFKTRRTQRRMGTISYAELGAWLDLSCRAQLVQGSDCGFEISMRPAPSAGAIHPIHLILSGAQAKAWQRYNSVDHALIDVPSNLDAEQVRRAMLEVLPVPDATLILFAAEVGKTATKYEHPASLVWRDAGALLAVMGFAAHALSLAFCPLGVTGEPWVGQLLQHRGLFGVGAAFVGTRAANG